MSYNKLEYILNEWSLKMAKLPDIEKSIVLNHPIHHVWDAIATSKGINGWLMPNTFQPIVGHDFTMSAGGFGESPCTVTEIVTLEKVAFDWAKDWQLTMLVDKIDDHTTVFKMIHSGWDDNIETEFNQPHTVVRGLMEEGWENIVNEKLPYYLLK